MELRRKHGVVIGMRFSGVLAMSETAQNVTVTPTATGIAIAMWNNLGAGLCPMAVRELNVREADALIATLIEARRHRSKSEPAEIL